MGLIELPGTKGEIRIPYDLTTGNVNVHAKGLAYPQIVQLLLAAAAATVNVWVQAEAGIVGRKGNSDGDQETSKENDHDNNR